LTADPDPASSNRNGISTPGLTTTVASQSAGSDWAPALAGNAASSGTRTAKRTDSFVFIQDSLKRKKAREAVSLPGLLSAENLSRAGLCCRFLSGHDLYERSTRQAGGHSGQATQALATADHVHTCTFIVENRPGCQSQTGTRARDGARAFRRASLTRLKPSRSSRLPARDLPMDRAVVVRREQRLRLRGDDGDLGIGAGESGDRVERLPQRDDGELDQADAAGRRAPQDVGTAVTGNRRELRERLLLQVGDVRVGV